MIRQYRAHRRRGGANPLGVGVIAAGSIYYLQDRGFFHDRFGGRARRSMRDTTSVSPGCTTSSSTCSSVRPSRWEPLAFSARTTLQPAA